MLLIIFVGLIAKLALVCDGCNVGTQEVNNFDWNQVGIFVLTQFVNEVVFITAASLHNSH
jgi:hypothetical protein